MQPKFRLSKVNQFQSLQHRLEEKKEPPGLPCLLWLWFENPNLLKVFGRGLARLVRRLERWL